MSNETAEDEIETLLRAVWDFLNEPSPPAAAGSADGTRWENR